MILRAILLLLTPLVVGCNLNPQFGIWMVKDCDTVWKAAVALGINTTDIQNLNPTRTMDWYITSGQEYTVPYKTMVTPPATWVTTESCVPRLLLRNTACGKPSEYGSVLPSNTTTYCKAEIKTVASYPIATTSTITETITPPRNLTFSTTAAATFSASTSSICYARPDRVAKDKMEVFIYSRWACKKLVEKLPVLQSSNDNIAVSLRVSSFDFHYFAVRWIDSSFGPQRISPNCTDLIFGVWERCE